MVASAILQHGLLSVVIDGVEAHSRHLRHGSQEEAEDYLTYWGFRYNMVAQQLDSCWLYNDPTKPMPGIIVWELIPQEEGVVLWYH